MTIDEFTASFGAASGPLQGAWAGAVAAAVLRGDISKEEGDLICMEAMTAFEAAIREWPSGGPAEVGWAPGVTVAVIPAEVFTTASVGEPVSDSLISALGAFHPAVTILPSSPGNSE